MKIKQKTLSRGCRRQPWRSPSSEIASPVKNRQARNDGGVRAVLFDLGNVLVNFDATKAAKRFSKTYGVPVKKIWHHFFTDPTEKAYTRGQISCEEFFEHAKTALIVGAGLKPAPALKFETFKFYWNDIFWKTEGMDKLLARLEKNYPLYLVSNTNRMHFDHLKKNFKILRHFKKMFPSHEVGHRKPEPQIYKKVLKAIRLKPKETVFVDDIPKFVEGARAVGMHAIQFKNPRQLIRSLKKLGIKI